MRSSRSLDTAIDDDRLVADARLLLRPPWPTIFDLKGLSTSS